MDQKTISWVSYLTIVGWIIAIVSYNNSTDKSSLARFHLRQSLGIFLSLLAVSILSMMFLFILGPLSFLFYFINIGLFILLIIGLVAAANGEEKPVPVLGEFYQRSLTFIN